MSDPDGDPQDLAARLAALSDTQLLTVLSVVTSGRPRFEPVFEAITRLLAHSGETAPEPDVNPSTPAPPGYRPPFDPPPSPQVRLPLSGGIADVPGGRGGIGGYTANGVPTFDSVRDKVERRFGVAQGREELDRETPAGRDAEEQWEAREQAARARLDKIRKSVRGDGA